MVDLWRVANSQAQRIPLLKHRETKRYQIQLLLKTIRAAINQPGRGNTPLTRRSLPARRQPDLFN